MSMGKRVGAALRRALGARRGRVITAVTVASVGAVALGGVALGAHLIGSSDTTAPTGVAATAPTSAATSSSPPDVTTQPASTATPSAEASSSPTPAGNGGGAASNPTTNVLMVVPLIPAGLDAVSGQPLCFSKPIGLLSVTQDGRTYGGVLDLQEKEGGTFTQMPLRISSAAAPMTYDVTPQGCFTFTQPTNVQAQYQVWQQPDQSPAVWTSLEIRVDAAGVAEVPPVLLSVAPAAPLQEKAGVESGFLSYVDAQFRDGTDDEDAYSGYVDWGDGTAHGQLAVSTADNGVIMVVVGDSHTWAKPGTYTMTLYLVDSDGGPSTATLTVDVA
jgi:hypothetical protein